MIAVCAHVLSSITGCPGGGASCLGVGRPGSGALPAPTARPLGMLPGPTTHWLWVRGGAGVGTRHQPPARWLCALWGRHEGAQGGRLLPGCGASGVGRSPTPDCPPSGRAAGAHYQLAVGAGDAGVGTRDQPHSARSCELAVRAVGAARGRPRGVPPAWVWGVRGRALFQPRLPALWAGCRGPLPTGCGCGGVRAWRPVTNPTAHALASWLCALWGRHECARGGRLLPGCGASGVGRSPGPDCPPSGRADGAHYPLAVGAGGCGRGDPSPTPQRAGFPRCGGGMRVPRGGASCLGVGRPGSGALPPPTARPLGGLPGPTTHWLWVRGGAGVGTRHQPHSARSCELAVHAVGGAQGRPGGAPPAWVRGVRGRALSHPQLPALWAGCRGPLRTGCGCGGLRAWGPVTNPTARWLCALWGRHEGARGGRLLPGCGASRVGRFPTPDCPPSGRAAGAHYPMAVGAGGAGVGTRHQPHSARSCELALRATGAARGRPGGGASCLGMAGASGVGRSPTPDCPPSGRAAVCACACPAWPGRAGRPPRRVLVRLTFPLAVLASLFACSAPSGLGLPCLWLWLVFFFGFCLFFFLFFFLFISLFSPLLRHRCVLLCMFSGPGCHGPWRLGPPPFFLSCPPPPPPSVRPVVSCFACFPAWGALGLDVLSPPPFLDPPLPVVSGVSCFPVALGLCPPPPPFVFCSFPAAFVSCCASAVCVLGCRAVCSLSCPFVVLCASSVLLLVAGVVGSWCRCLLLGVCWWLWLPGVVAWWCVSALVPMFGLAVAGRPPFGVPFPCAVSCGAVLPCGAVLWCPVFFLCFSPCWWRWVPVVPRWFWAPGRFRVVSVSVLCLRGAVLVCLRRCSLFGALLPSRGWLVFCVVACCVFVFAVGPGCPLLSPGGSRWLLVSCLGGVLWCVPGCCAAPCCCALCRLALRCCALCCFVLLRLVLPRAVWCPGALSVVLGSCAFWRPVLSCPPALCVFCCGVSPSGVARRCALCRVRPGVSCCVFPVVSALCGVAVWPALPWCPAPLCCAAWCCAAAWCRGVLPCRLVGFVTCVGVVVPT